MKALTCHLLGVFNTPTTVGPDGIANAFASKVVRMAKVLKRLGYKVIVYGVEGSDVECDEFVQVSSKWTLEKAYGKWDQEHTYGCKFGDVAYKTFTANAITEINKRKKNGDFLLCSQGTFHKEIADAVKIPITVEIGIGYTGSFAPYRIFESYFQMNWTYGQEGIVDGRFYDCVIPGFFEPSDFEYSENKEDFFLYLGRVVVRKGVQIAINACERLGKNLVVAGFGMTKEENRWDGDFFEMVKKHPNVEFVGFADLEKRKMLMSRAKAVFMPTLYLEPFGYVAIEAMFSGTPVITTDHGAFNETVVHGKTGYRCHTLEQFVWAAKNIDMINAADCRSWATENFSMDNAVRMYGEYFEMLQGLFGKGWYEEKPERKQLYWLDKEYIFGDMI